MFSLCHLQVYFSLKGAKRIPTTNDGVIEFIIQCISGFGTSNGLEIQTLWFQILPEPLNFSFHSHLLNVRKLTVSRGPFELEPKH